MTTLDISVRIEGMTPLICNNFTDAAALAATNGSRSSLVGDKGTPKQIAESKLYLDPFEGHPIIPGPNLFRCIIDGGKFTKAGKSKVTTLKSSLIPACLTLAEIHIPIEHRDPWEVDARAVRNPGTGGRLLCYRPIFNDWALAFSLTLDTEILAEPILRTIIDDAGKRIGLGDFRPDCKGPYGRFVVTSWKREE